MSIRLWSDGHSFPREALQKALCGTVPKGEEPLCIELLSPRTTLAPEAARGVEQPEELLRLAGVPCRENECALWSEAVEGIVAAMAIDRSTHQQLPEGCSFTSPLLDNSLRGEHVVALSRYENLIYIKVWGQELRLAEVITVAGNEDLIYYISRLGELIPLREYTLRTGGESPRELQKLLKNYFK